VNEIFYNYIVLDSIICIGKFDEDLQIVKFIQNEMKKLGVWKIW